MKSVRLLPIVIFAALALLVFKGIGLVTNGGYVLTGTDVVLAAGGEAPAALAAGEAAAPSEVTATDTSPTVEDTAPTLATGPAPAGEGEAAPAAEAGEGAPAAGETESAAPTSEALVACPPTEPTAAGGEGEGAAPAEGEAQAIIDCLSSEPIPVNEFGDAVPTIQDGSGKIVPLQAAEGDNSEEALLARLSERRADLDKREADIAMRMSLVEAAEKRLDDRAKELEALQAQVAALVDEKQAAEDAGFKSVVTMYEAMKPKDAAKIFDGLELNVMIKVARAISPRKMSPILAAMSSKPAEALTTALAAIAPTPVVAGGENLAALPQIVGQ